MCTKKSLASWLDTMQEIAAWEDRSTLTGLNFKFKPTSVLLVVSRDSKKGIKEVAFIETADCKECLRYLWLHYNTTSAPIRWKASTFGT